MLFSELGLLPELLRAVTARGYDTPTPVQAQAIPVILTGRDLLAGAQTGTGKTAGFTLPLLQRLQATPRHAVSPRALVLAPTRELAAQVGESVRSYGQYLSLRSAVIFGGVNINPQIDQLRRGVDILIATPGRLLDHVQQRTVDLSQVEIFVLDEADRMLDMGFIHDIRRVIRVLPAQRQNLLFSATYSDDIRKLAHGLLKDPAEVEVARRNTAVETVSQSIYATAKEQKRALLSHLIRANDWPQVLVFTRTKHGANRLTKQLQDDGLTAAAIHGNKSQSARVTALNGFKNSSIRVLVATEVAARGLDIKELPYVVNYELPNVPEDYVHRIGRTGRAGATGMAVSLVSPDENGLLRDVEKLIRQKITVMPLPEISAPPPRPAMTVGEQRQSSHSHDPNSLDRPSQGRQSQGHGGRGDGHRSAHRSGNHSDGHGGQGRQDRPHGRPAGQPSGQNRPARQGHSQSRGHGQGSSRPMNRQGAGSR